MTDPQPSKKKNGAPNPTPTAPASTPAITPASTPPTMSPEDAKRAAAATEAMAATLGRMMALMMTSPRHKKLTMEEVNTLIMPPLALGQFAVVGARNQKDGPMAIAAVAFWAFVSPEVDKRLTDSRDAVLKIEPSEWKSGSIPWVVEALGEQKVLNELLKQVSTRNFNGATAKLRAYTPKGEAVVGKIEAPKS